MKRALLIMFLTELRKYIDNCQAGTNTEENLAALKQRVEGLLTALIQK